MDSLSTSESLLADGIIGPFPLSIESRKLLPLLSGLISNEASLRNLHSKHRIVRSVVKDPNIVSLVANLFPGSYFLWRTNFFRRESGVMHLGVPLHHDKHFQSGDLSLDFYELGSHLSLIISLDKIDESNGSFQYIPGSHYGSPEDFDRDRRPFESRPISDHFPSLPSSYVAKTRSLDLPYGSFCLFHSALLHGSAPSQGLNGRTSMVARLVRSNCIIPANCANSDDIFSYP